MRKRGDNNDDPMGSPADETKENEEEVIRAKLRESGLVKKLRTQKSMDANHKSNGTEKMDEKELNADMEIEKESYRGKGSSRHRHRESSSSRRNYEGRSSRRHGRSRSPHSRSNSESRSSRRLSKKSSDSKSKDRKGVKGDEYEEKHGRVKDTDSDGDKNMDKQSEGGSPSRRAKSRRSRSPGIRSRSRSSRRHKSRGGRRSRSPRERSRSKSWDRHRSRDRTHSRKSDRESRDRRGSSRRSRRSRSHSRRHRSRSSSRSSRSRSRSRSSRHRHHRRSSKHEKKKETTTKRDANSSPEPQDHPLVAAVAQVAATTPQLQGSAASMLTAPSGAALLTQLMQQHPNMSLQEIMQLVQSSSMTTHIATAAAMKPARDLYVGNLAPNITGPQLQEFLGTIIQQVGLALQPGNPIMSTWISTDGHFAFCEMRSAEECNLALLLNQLPLLGQPLKFGRPKSFTGPLPPMPMVSARTSTALSNLGCTPNPAWFAAPGASVAAVGANPLSLLSNPIGLSNPSTPATSSVEASVNALLGSAAASTSTAYTASTASNIPNVPLEVSPTQLLMSNIPTMLTSDQVTELVSPFGVLNSFRLVLDPNTGMSTGKAIFEYEEESSTKSALEGLEGLELGGEKPLSIRLGSGTSETSAESSFPTSVVQLTDMVTEEELKDDEEFADLMEDVKEECQRFGTVVGIKIPRPSEGVSVPGVGNVFVRFNNSDEAVAAIKALAGRKFGGNVVKAHHFSADKFEANDFA